ncbi:MAG: hypothetical protein II477_11105, partial [Lachnospiraceae bacterium]|nr:hypothetical protein [Lachnospiraceae bacterium]
FIRGISLGMFDMQSADGVPANDKKAPEAIAEAAIQVCAITESVVDVTWTAPKDGGTPYWFRCESIDVLTGEKLCDSNIVKNVLTTGVAGYYYRLDDAPVITVTAQNADNAGDLLLNAKLRCTLRAEETYLHLAAVDVAGNIGPTTHVKLSGKDVAMRYPIVTRPISIEGEEGKANVYAASDGRIFVRADGVTPFRLSFEAFIGGVASEDYQITDLDFSIAYDAPGDAYAFETKVPLSSDPASLTEAVSLSVSKFIRKGSGEEVILTDAGLTGAARGMAGKQTLFWQGFLASESAHGRIICVTPGAAAGENATYQHSAWEEDEKNCISFIADAQAPVVTCSADLAALDVINEATLPAQVLVFQATDDLSGLAYFEVKVRNQDTGDAKTYVSDDSGEIRIDYDPAQALFCGDLTMELTTYDNVYNTYQETYGKVEFSLEASIMRILEPHAPRFKRGESGRLCITAIGYAEKIEVVFPPEIAGDAPELNHTFYYAVPTEVASEELQFMIPLYLNVEDEYQVIVRAYKGTAVLEARPELCTLHVAGSILDELRTRLK